jgi:hypothetical protein
VPLPDHARVAFVIAGTQRGGTTTLATYLRQHPQVALPLNKEVHFFDNEKLWQAGQPDYAAYHASFPPGSDNRVFGDATPIYMYWQPALPRMRDYNPAMKLIMILRNPIERAYSHWNHERQAQRETLPFREALLAEAGRAQKAAPLQLRYSSYVARGMYAQQLTRIAQFFPAEQLLVLRMEDLLRALAPLFVRVADFLGIQRFSPAQYIVAHARSYEQPLPAADRRYLIGVFGDEIRALERLLGWDCSDWLKENTEEDAEDASA